MKQKSKKLLRLISVAFSLSLICTFLLGASKISPTSDFYVNDFAEVLSPETESEIMSNAVKLQKDTTAQVVVLTIADASVEDLQEYSVEVFENWGIGEKGKDNGVLIALNTSTRNMWVTTGYGVEGTLTDISLGKLRDTYAIPYYKENNFDKGTLELFNAIVNELRVTEYGLEPIGEYEPIDEIEYIGSEKDDSPMFLFMFLPFILVAVILIGQRIKLLYYKFYDKRNGTNKAETYKKKLKAKQKGNQNSNDDDSYGGGIFFGGGFGGGGGFSGGGGGFSGGGGSTGGGGAGGSF